MLRLTTTITILSTILLVSCNTIEPRALADISFKFNRCRLRCYDFNKLETIADDNCGENFESGDYPLEACEGVIGAYVDDFATELRPKILKNIQACKDKGLKSIGHGLGLESRP